jgi:polysaccharide export outer membrane protein
MNKFLGLVVVLVFAALAGCATARYDVSVFGPATQQPYRLASGDRLRVIVFGQDSLSNSFSVNGAGNISMPLVGDVRVAGLTTPEVEQTIDARLRQGYLREPRASVEVEAYRPFFILGEVTTAGQYPFINGMTVQNAVAVAGGFTPRAVEGSVDITRLVDGRPLTASAPLWYPVRPGDTITVRERFF